MPVTSQAPQIAQGYYLITLLIYFLCVLIQNLRIAEVGRHLWKSFSLNSCSEQGHCHLEQVAQGYVQSGVNTSKNRDSTSSLCNLF